MSRPSRPLRVSTGSALFAVVLTAVATGSPLARAAGASARKASVRRLDTTPPSVVIRAIGRTAVAEDLDRSGRHQNGDTHHLSVGRREVIHGTFGSAEFPAWVNPLVRPSGRDVWQVQS